MFRGFHGIDILAAALALDLYRDAGAEAVLHIENRAVGSCDLWSDIVKDGAVTARNDSPGCIKETTFQLRLLPGFLHVRRSGSQPVLFEFIDSSSAGDPCGVCQNSLQFRRRILWLK